MYDGYLLENEAMLIVSSILFLIFMILGLLACIAAYVQSQISKFSKFQALFVKLERVFLISFVLCELTIMSCFIMTAQIFQILSRIFSSPSGLIF